MCDEVQNVGKGTESQAIKILAADVPAIFIFEDAAKKENGTEKLVLARKLATFEEIGIPVKVEKALFESWLDFTLAENGIDPQSENAEQLVLALLLGGTRLNKWMLWIAGDPVTQEQLDEFNASWPAIKERFAKDNPEAGIPELIVNLENYMGAASHDEVLQ